MDTPANSLDTQTQALADIMRDLDAASQKLFARVPGDPDAVEDYLAGQEAFVRALRFMQRNTAVPFDDSTMRYLIVSTWYFTRHGFTRGTAMACERLLRFLVEK